MTTEFVKQTLRENLTRVLVPQVADGLWSIYENAKIACERNKQPEKTLQTFQNLLTRVPQWTEDILNKEVERIIKVSKCDYIEDLLLGVFVSYIRAFASLQQTDMTHVDLHFDRPSLNKFIHTFYIYSARKSWTCAYLFNTIQVKSEKQAQNRREIETMLEGTMNEVIDSFIPWRDISKAYFQTPEAPPNSPENVRFMDRVEVAEISDDEDSEDTEDDEPERPKLTVGEEMQLDFDDDDDTVSVNTEDELEQKAEKEQPLSLEL
jgi:hypothetical protein